jgi:hypothetical protein
MSSDLVVLLDTGVSASATIASMFESGDIREPGLTFENPELSAEQKLEVGAAISAAKHSANSLAALLDGANTLVKGKEYVGKAFVILGVEWRASDIEGEGCPVWALLSCADVQGESFKMSVGAWSVVESVALGDVKGFFGPDAWVQLIAVPLEKGRTALELHTAEGPFAR